MQPSLFENSIEKEYSFYNNQFLSIGQIEYILDYIKYVETITPFFTPTMKNGAPYRVKITSLGKYGWISDNKGYYYSRHHPNGVVWMPISQVLYKICQYYFDQNNLKYNAKNFDSCLINRYESDSKLGMHVDNTEKDLTFPIMSFSIGSSAQFDIEFGNSKKSYLLENGNVIIMAGKSRLCKHGIRKIINDKNHKERVNLTFRKTGL
jgi:alkylated DNA repair protein (DNA oxidative demethylase)